MPTFWYTHFVMTTSPLQTLLGTCTVLLLLAAGTYFYMSRPTNTGPSTTASTTSQTLSDGTVISGLPEGATVNELPPESQPQALKAPDYRTKVAYDPSVSAEVRAAIETQFAANVMTLSKNPQDFSTWMNLAILHKIGGDYRGAETIWLYATKNWPNSPVAFSNLADLYQNFLKDSAKAKVYADLAAKLSN